MSTDDLRVVWTAFCMAVATVALGGAVIMFWLERDALKTDEAVSQVRTPRSKFMRITTRGEVIDLRYKVWVAIALMVAMGLHGMAGLMAIVGGPSGVVFWSLISGEIMVGVAVALLTRLGLGKRLRQERLFGIIPVVSTEPAALSRQEQQASANEALRVTSQEANTAQLTSMSNMGEDTNVRVRKVEGAVVQTDAVAAEHDRRIDALETESEKEAPGANTG